MNLFNILQSVSGVDTTLDILLIILVTLVIVVVLVIGLGSLTLFLRVRRAVNKFEKLIESISQLPRDFKMAGLFSGMGASLYGFMNGFKNRVSNKKSDRWNED